MHTAWYCREQASYAESKHVNVFKNRLAQTRAIHARTLPEALIGRPVPDSCMEPRKDRVKARLLSSQVSMLEYRLRYAVSMFRHARKCSVRPVRAWCSVSRDGLQFNKRPMFTCLLCWCRAKPSTCWPSDRASISGSWCLMVRRSPLACMCQDISQYVLLPYRRRDCANCT